jgi:hypothetical protein
MFAAHRWQYILVSVIFFIGLLFVNANATPVTGAATLVGTNNATIGCTGTTGAWYVQYGETDPGYWKTPNQSSGTSTTIRGSMFGTTQYLYACCDTTGCGSTSSFTTADVTPLPTYYLGDAYRNITENNYDIRMIGLHIADPYLWNPNMPLPIIFMLMFSPVFIGIWLRSRTVLVALVFGFVISSFILFNNGSSGLGISMPPELVSLCQAICYVAFAGCIIYVIHK